MRVGTDGVLLGAWCDLASDVSAVIPDESTDRRQIDNVCPDDPSQVLERPKIDQTVWNDEMRDEEDESVCGAQNGTEATKKTKEVGRVLDIGSGTGVIALMVAQRTSNAQIDAVEPDSGSCEDALRNFAESPWADRLHLHGVTLQEYVSCYAEKVQYDLIVSNPPYIPDGDIAELDASVRDYEPHLALRGGADGLDFYRAIAGHWTAALRVGGRLLFEVGIGQADEVLRIMRSVGFGDLEITPDLNGIPRVVEGVLCSEL